MYLKSVFLSCFLILVFCQNVVEQLSTEHYIPPFITNKIPINSIDDYFLLLSTPSDTSFYVKIYEGTAVLPKDSLLISSQHYAKYKLKKEHRTIGLFRRKKYLNIALNTYGLYLKADFPFFANLRGFSGAHGISITSKGKEGLGTRFRTGHLYAGVNVHENSHSLCFHSISVMATQNNTKVSFSDFKKGCVFINTETEGKNKKQQTTIDHSVVLQKGQSYVLAESPLDFDLGDENKSFGTYVESSKPIALICGSSIMINPKGGSGYDSGMDQIVPTNALGNQYIILKGEGTEEHETTVAVATEDGTTIQINGKLQAVKLKAGDYFVIEGYHFDGTDNLYLETNKKVAVYQTTFGSKNPATASLNFIPPLNDCMTTNEINITDIPVMGEHAVVNIITKKNSEIQIFDIDTKKELANVYANKCNVPSDPAQEWFTYKYSVPTDVKAISIVSDAAISVSMTNYSGVIGAAAYFSGFSLTPIIVAEGGKIAFYENKELVLKLRQVEGFKEFLWYRNGKLLKSTKKPFLNITQTGTYYVEGIESMCNGTRRSADFVLQELEQMQEEEIEELFVEEGTTELENMILNKNFDSGVLVNLKYKYNSPEIEETSYLYLDEILSTLKKYTKVRLQINAHTDCRGDAAYNLSLSQKRAQFIKDYLVTRGIAAERLVAKGMGETRPLTFLNCGCETAKQCSEASHALNRRSEFLVLSE